MAAVDARAVTLIFEGIDDKVSLLLENAECSYW